MSDESSPLKGIHRKLLVYISGILLWEMVFRLHLWPEYLFPSPLGVVQNLISGFGDSSYLVAIGVSIKRVLIGYFVSLVIGCLLGVLIIRFRWLDESISPLMLGLQTLPSICWLPLAILWFGVGEDAIVFVIAIGSIFSICISVISGIKNVPPIYLRAARTMGARGFRAYTDVIFPASLPAFVSGMKQGWSFAWRALMAGELLSPKDGLGYVLTMGRDLHDMNQVIGVMAVIIALGLIIDKLFFGRLEYNIRYRWGLLKS